MQSLRHILLALILTVGIHSSAFAEGTKIAVVNIQGIMKDSKAAKSVRSQLESKQKAYQAQISKMEESMQKEEQELGKQRSVLSQEAFEKKVQDFRTKATKMQRDVQGKKATLDSAFEGALNDIQKVVSEIISTLAKEKGFQVAVPTSQLLYAEPAIDISDEVLSRLNKKLPKVSVKFEKK